VITNPLPDVYTAFQASAAVTRIESITQRGPLPIASASMVSLAPVSPTSSLRTSSPRRSCPRTGGATHYAPSAGDPRLRERIASDLSALSARPFAAEDVLVTHGGTGGLATVILGAIDPGDRVVVHDPTYSLYADLVAMAGGVCVPAPLDADLHWDLDALADALAGRACWCSAIPAIHGHRPHPRRTRSARAHAGGYGHHRRRRRGVQRTRLRRGRLRLGARSPLPRRAYRALQTFSKRFAMTGWRIGYVAGPRAVVNAASRIHATTAGPVNTAVQRASMVAMDTRRTSTPWWSNTAPPGSDGASARRGARARHPRPRARFYVFPTRAS